MKKSKALSAFVAKQVLTCTPKMLRSMLSTREQGVLLILVQRPFGKFLTRDN